jgi:hypothetical protein
MFADDTFTLDCNHDHNDLITNVNIEINKMAVWFRANKLAVNISKTKYIIFRMKGKNVGPNTPNVIFNEIIYGRHKRRSGRHTLARQKNIQNKIFNENEPNTPIDPNLITTLERYYDDHPDSNCRSYKLLGIHLDEHLTLNSHTNHVVNKLSRSLYCIKQARHIIPP